jgi:hypothetical protein
MDNREENKLTNYLTRKVVLDANAAAIATIPALGLAVPEWTGVVALIQTLGNKQGADLTGLAEAKANLRALMARRALIVKNKVGPFAARTGDAVLAAKVDVNPSDFVRARDTEADDIAIRILEAAQANEAALVADYGLTAALLDGLESAIEGYSALIGKPAAAIKGRKSMTEQLDAEFAAADALLETQIDPLIASLELDFPAFVADYANAKKINQTRSGSPDAAPAPAVGAAG